MPTETTKPGLTLRQGHGAAVHATKKVGVCEL
jgi:hypothetical protein